MDTVPPVTIVGVPKFLNWRVEGFIEILMVESFLIETYSLWRNVRWQSLGII